VDDNSQTPEEVEQATGMGDIPQSIMEKMDDASYSMPDGEEEQIEEGWTRVGKGKGRPPAFIHGVNPFIRDYTLNKLRADFDSKTRRWRASRCRKAVLQILNKQQPDDGWQIGNAVCLATGSYCRDNWQSRQRSVMQFVAFADIVGHLQSKQSAEFSSYAQEPQYTPLDKAFLTSLNVTPLDRALAGEQNLGLGAATQYLNPSTFIFEPFMDLGVDSMRDLFSADVRLYIGSSMRRWTDDSRRSDEEVRRGLRQTFKVRDEEISEQNIESIRTQSSQAVKFVQSRRSYRFPRFEDDPNVFEGLAIFWKEPQDEA